MRSGIMRRRTQCLGAFARANPPGIAKVGFFLLFYFIEDRELMTRTEPAAVLQRSRAVEPAVARADRDVHNAAAGLQAARPRWVDVVIQEHLATHYGV
jgi:hypothetical protein